MPIRLTPVVKALLIACGAIFIVQQTADRFMGFDFTGTFGLVPYAFVVDHWFWQLFTYLFLHGDVTHLVLNLLMLAFMGGEIEAVWGRWRFIRYYFVCGLSAGMLYLLLQVGASGAIYGLLAAYGVLFGERTLLFMLLFPMKAKHFVWLLMGVELLTSLFSGRNGLASAAHLGGMIAGLVTLWAQAVLKAQVGKGGSGWNPFGPRKRSRNAGQHLRLVGKSPPPEKPDDSKPPRTWH